MPKGDDFHIEPAQQATEGDLARQNMQEKINLGYVSNAFEFDSQSKTGIFSLTIDPAGWRRRVEAWVTIVKNSDFSKCGGLKIFNHPKRRQ